MGLEVATNELLAKGLTTVQRITDLLDRSPGRKGARRLCALISPDDGYTRNKAERLLRQLMPDTGLTGVRYNGAIGRYRTLRDSPGRVIADVARATSPGTTRA